MIVVDQVSKHYRNTAAVSDLSFTIEEGECVGFLGLNGAGKTTTLRLLSCLLLPTSGTIKVAGLDAERSPHEIRKMIGFLPDRPPLYEEMTVGEYLRFAAELRQTESSTLKKYVDEALETTGLTDVAHQEIQTLSHGYRQRVGIAQAIVHKPQLLILDEPIQGLDPVQIVEMRQMIRSLRGQHTILLSTHILSEVQQTCDRYLVLNQGKIAGQFTESELSESANTRTVEVEVSGAGVCEPDSALYTELTQISSVSSVQSESSNDGTKIVVTAEADVRALISRAVVEAGHDLLRLERVESELESHFLSLVSEEGGSDA